MEETKIEKKSGEQLLNLAVVIMGTISCYTTAVGLAPMLGNKFFAYLIAVALSLFMIVIAVNFASSNKRGGMILAYSIVALFSIILNFNAIYGISNANRLLYTELNEKISALSYAHQTILADLKKQYKVDELQATVDAAFDKMKQEGDIIKCGPKCQEIKRTELRPAERARDAAIRDMKTQANKANVILNKVYPEPLTGYSKSKNHKEIDKGIQMAISTYQELVSTMTPITQETYPTVEYEERNIGDLSHTVSAIFSFGEKDAQGKAAIFVSLLISFLIDFIILFVVWFLAPSPPLEEEDFNRRGRHRHRGRSSGRDAPIFTRSKNSTKKADRPMKDRENEGPFVKRSS